MERIRENGISYANVIRRMTAGPQTYIKNRTQLRNAERKRNDLLQSRVYQYVLQYVGVSPKNIYVINIIQSIPVIFSNFYVNHLHIIQSVKKRPLM